MKHFIATPRIILKAYRSLQQEDPEEYEKIKEIVMKMKPSNYTYQKIMKALHQPLKTIMKNDKAEFDKHTRQDILNEYEYLQQDDPEKYEKFKEVVMKMEAPDFEDMNDSMWEVWTTDDFYQEFLISAFERKFDL